MAVATYMMVFTQPRELPGASGGLHPGTAHSIFVNTHELMKERPLEKEIRIVYGRPGYDTQYNHRVRSRMEAAVCDWLMQHGIAHRHASEVFALSVGSENIPNVYVPDIVLHDRRPDGKIILIETHQVNSPKQGGTRLLAAFRAQMKRTYFLIVIARVRDMKTILNGSYDVLVDFEKLDSLERKLPRVGI